MGTYLAGDSPLSHMKCLQWWSDFNQNWNFGKLSNIRFHENMLSGSEVVTCGQTDMAKLIGAFLQLLVAEVPKNYY
jgi:hypothetical protein